MGNISEDLKQLENTLKKLESKRDGLIQDEGNEVEATKKTIREKYGKQLKPVYEEIGKAEKQIEDYCKKIEFFSTFDAKVIGEILEQLLTIFEGEEYYFEEAEYYTKRIKHCVFDRIEIDVDESVRMIIKAEYKNSDSKYNSRFTNIIDLVYNGHAIVLQEEDNKPSSNISFNCLNDRNNGINSDVLYGRFNYVKEFIDCVIDYRINNNIANMNKDDLHELLVQFLAERKDSIEANYQQRLQEKQESLKQQLEDSQNQYSAQLKKIIVQKP